MSLGCRMELQSYFVVLVLTVLAVLCAADPEPFYNSHDYTLGKFGIFPEVKFQTTHYKAPRFNVAKWDPKCDSDELFLIAPRGLMVGPAGPTIMSLDGRMMWHREDFGVAYGLMVQRYKGEDVLTFWSGDDMVVGHGSGYYYMFDKNYRQVHKIPALSNLTGDLHEFKITKDNTALLTSYKPIEADLSHFQTADRAQGWIYDCYFQEIDIETQKLLFEWRATDHFRVQDCFNQLRESGTEQNPFDYYHINSVDKDNKGNYIVSARYSHAITYVDGKTGSVLWHLGGRNNSFKDLSAGRATNFAWQHDARWHNDYTTISIFDNAAYFGEKERPARGIEVAVDTKAMTAELIHEWSHPDNFIAESQGSLQILDNGNAFLGYGSVPAFTEFTPDGRVLCDVQFGALYYAGEGKFSPGAVMSYRSFKHRWKGYPLQNPRVKFHAGSLYVSWNGATEVRTWVLEAAEGLGRARDMRSVDWVPVGNVSWMGFESNISVLEALEPKFNSALLVYKLTALDGAGDPLGTWLVDTDDSVQALGVADGSGSGYAQDAYPGISLLTLAVLAMAVGALLSKRRDVRGLVATVQAALHQRRSEKDGLPLLGDLLE